MKLQQLRYLREVARQGLNLSAAAEALHTSQPGISKQIRLLEEELGVEILVRNGKRVAASPSPAASILDIAERILHEADNLKQVGARLFEPGQRHADHRHHAHPGALCAAAGDPRASSSAIPRSSSA